MTDIRLKISSPWVTFVNEVIAMFQHDPEIKIEYDNDEVEVRLYVDNPEKAAALELLLPYEVCFGNVILSIAVIPSNDDVVSVSSNVETLFNLAFNGNPVFAFTRSVEGILSNKITYVVFKNRVVQFFNDNLNDIHGNISTLYEEIARNIFNEEELYGVFYCTDIEEKVGMPLGEWP